MCFIMFNTISISELQKSPSKIFKQTKWYTYVLSNNKKTWLIFPEHFIKFFEDSWLLHDIDRSIINDNDSEIASSFDVSTNDWKIACLNYFKSL